MRAPALTRRSVLPLLSLGALIFSRRQAAAETGSSPWVKSGQANVRLIDAGAQDGGRQRLAGLQMRLDPDVLTYWRTPGEAGVPPTPDFSKSGNLAAAEWLYPAPGRFDEGGAEAFGYKEGVLFPILVTPTDPKQPVDLALSLDFALCAKLCVPARAALGLTLAPDGAPPEAGLVREALARVPVPRALGAAGTPAIESVRLAPDAASVEVVARAANPTALFPETPDGWFLQADAGVPAGADRMLFTLRILSRPEGSAPARLPLRLTLTTGAAAVETPVDLDVSPHKP